MVCRQYQRSLRHAMLRGIIGDISTMPLNMDSFGLSIIHQERSGQLWMPKDRGPLTALTLKWYPLAMKNKLNGLSKTRPPLAPAGGVLFVPVFLLRMAHKRFILRER
jgi:hypothetical protein